mgnify:CR=1 FL=1
MKAYSAAQVSQNSLDMLAHFIKKDELVKMFHYLSFTGDAKSLRDLVDIAKKLNTDIYTEQSANVFKEALAEAERLRQAELKEATANMVLKRTGDDTKENVNNNSLDSTSII